MENATFNANMPFKGKHQGRGRGRLLIIVTSQYAVLFLSSLASAAAIYLILGPFGTLFTASNVTILSAVSGYENMIYRDP